MSTLSIEAAPQPDGRPLDAATSSRALFFSVFPSIMLPMFLAALDQTIVATALPAIAVTTGDAMRISWVVVSYLIATTIAAPIYGKLGDSLGRKKMMLLALPLFIVASGLCAASHGIISLTFARLLQGLGGGGLMTLSQALIGESVPPRERGRYQGYLASIFMASSTFGPVVGGYLTQHFGWQSVFLINLPLGVIAFALVLRMPARSSTGGKLHLDVRGIGLFSLFIAALLLGLERIRNFDRQDIPVIAALAFASVLALYLLLRQEKRDPSPLLPIKFLSQAAIWRTDAMGSCVGASLVSMLSFMPIYLQIVRETTPSQTGLMLLPLTICIAIGALCTGRMIAKTGKTAIFPSYGMGAVTLVLLFAAFSINHVSTAYLPILFALFSLPMGTAMPVVQVTVQSVAGPKLLGIASASVQFSRSIGAAIGTALVGTVMFTFLQAIDPETASMFTQLLAQGSKALAGLSPDRQAVIQAEIGHAFRLGFLTIAGFSATGWILAMSIPVRRV